MSITLPTRPRPVMNLPFATRPHPRPGQVGTPGRASHCHCVGGPLHLVAVDECFRCGHRLKEIVAETWGERAARLAAERARRVAA